MGTTPAPTDEQLQILDLFRTGENLAVQAGAGTGKTTTLIQLAHATDKRCRYLALVSRGRRCPPT